MVTSLTSSLFLHWTSSLGSTPSDPSPETTQLMHNLAQYVHSLAQGKIGSGFDVSAAVYGSQVYKRFDVHCLGNLLENGDDKKVSHADPLRSRSIFCADPLLVITRHPLNHSYPSSRHLTTHLGPPRPPAPPLPLSPSHHT